MTDYAPCPSCGEPLFETVRGIIPFCNNANCPACVGKPLPPGYGARPVRKRTTRSRVFKGIAA